MNNLEFEQFVQNNGKEILRFCRMTCGDKEYGDELYQDTMLKLLGKLQRLDSQQNVKSYSRLSLNWNLNREIAKVNYRIHTDAIKDYLILPDLTPEQISYKYANEVDMLNVALFGMTARQWRVANPEKKGNIRDEANLNQLLVLANMESYNAILTEQGKNMSERLILLRQLAVKQMESLSLVNMSGIKQLPGGEAHE